MVKRTTGKRRYSKTSQKYVQRAMRKRKHGTLRRGKRGPGKGGRVKSREQAVAIGLSEARKAGAKLPPPPQD